jgi:DNA polymerase ligase (LigD)-like protein
MPRFVLLYHDCPPSGPIASHWDFMLETGEVLRTWRLDRLPAQWEAVHQRTAAKFRDCPPTVKDDLVAATPLGDHRLAYLDYEGEVSGGRGHVTRVSTGSYEIECETALQIKCVLEGDSIAGEIVLERSTPGSEAWMLSANR